MTAVVIERLGGPDAAGLLYPARPDLSALRIEQANWRAKLTELGRDYDDDVITRDEWLARRGRLNDRLAEIAAALADADSTGLLAPFSDGPAEQVWAGLDNAQRRAVIAAVCTVTVHPAGRGRRGFDPGTVVIGPR